MKTDLFTQLLRSVALRILVALSCLGSVAATSFAQSAGRVTGKVADRTTGEALPGANVMLVGTGFGTASNINGEYQILNVPAGQYKVRVTFIGYKPAELALQVAADRPTKLDIKLESTAIEVGVVEVSAQRVGQQASINRQLTSEAMINALSAEKIQQIPDANAAEAIGRLPGISMTRDGGEGSGVSIRGLAPKYSKITVSGVTIPSTNDVNRSTDLSMVAAENIAGIEVFKAITPDMDADAISGTVNITLAKARPERVQTARLYGAYNAMQKDWNQYKGFLKTEGRYLDDLLGVQATVNAERRNRSSDRLDASYLIGRETNGVIPIDISTASIQDRVEIRKRYGGSAILDYIWGDTKILTGNFYDQTDRSMLDRFHEYSNDRGKTRSNLNDQSTKESILTNMLRIESILLGMDVDATVSHSYTQNQILGFYQLVFEENTDLSKIDRSSDPSDFLRYLPVDSAAELRESTVRTRITTERNYGAELNLKYPLDFGGNVTGSIKVGGKYRKALRSNDREEGLWPSYLEQKKFYARDFIDRSYDPGNVLNGLTTLGLILDPGRNRGLADEYRSKYIFDVFWNNNDRYKTDEAIAAGYLMAKINFGQVLSIVPGVRVEAVDNAYTGYFRLQYGQTWPYHTGDYHDTTTYQRYTDFFPMLHVKVKPVEWFDVRMAVTRTLSRPDFWDLVPHMATSTNSDANITKGNPDLKPARSWNYDVYASFYDNYLGLFTVGAFYKKVDDITIHVRKPITQEIVDEFRILPHIGAVLNIPLNVPNSTIKGFEADLQTNLGFADFLPAALRGIVLGVNYTRLYSETVLPYYNKYLVSLRPVKYFQFDSLRTGRVPSQSDHILNLSVGYDYRGFSARASMHYQTESLDAVGVITETDTYTKAFTRWDITFRQAIMERTKLYLNFINLSNNPDGSYQYTPVKPSEIEYYGMMVDFGIQYEF